MNCFGSCNSWIIILILILLFGSGNWSTWGNNCGCNNGCGCARNNDCGCGCN